MQTVEVKTKEPVFVLGTDGGHDLAVNAWAYIKLDLRNQDWYKLPSNQNQYKSRLKCNLYIREEIDVLSDSEAYVSEGEWFMCEYIKDGSLTPCWMFDADDIYTVEHGTVHKTPVSSWQLTSESFKFYRIEIK